MTEGCLRRAAAADIDTLLPLIAEFYAIDGHDYDEALLLPALEPLLADDLYGLVWLIVTLAPERVVGYAVVTWSYSLESGGRDALLDEIYLRQRSTGLGSQALHAILADLQERGLDRMFLETERRNTRVRRFYSRHGFREEDSVWMCWQAPG